MPLLSSLKKSLSCLLTCTLILTTSPDRSLWSQAAQSGPQPQGDNSQYPGQGAPLSADQIDNLVSPIALYPDALVAQILGASTFPDQVATASNYLQVNKNLSGQALMAAVDKETWDPSVKALTQFPGVLDNLAKNLAWTSQLGEAYHNQQADVMAAIQHLRQQARAAGNLKSTQQQTVTTTTQNGQQVIVIQPANPQVVYVPTYSTTVVYGTPYTAPAYTTGDVVAAGVIGFGVGIAVGAMMAGGCCGWGWSSWNCGWYGGGVYYHGGAYYGNPAWHGGYYGTSGAAYGPYGNAHWGQGYNPSTGTYARGGVENTPYGSRGAAEAYNPYTGASGATRQAANAYGSAGASTVSRNGSTVDTEHVSNAYGTQAAAQGYNANTGAYGATRQGSNAYGNAGASTYTKNGQTVDTQHATAYGGNSVSTAESSNGNKYATVNGNAYKNTGSGVEKYSNGSWSNVTSTQSAKGYGSAQAHSSGSSAFSGYSSQAHESGTNGWGSREASSRGWASRGGGGGWGGGGGRGGFRR
jgi:hypothetical protein